MRLPLLFLNHCSFLFGKKRNAYENYNKHFNYLKLIMSFGVQFKILHNFSKVNKVIFLFFFSPSKVLLSIPFFSK